jgi:hypothetical protein
MQQQQQMQQEMLAAQEKQRAMELQAQSDRDDKMIQKDITVAEIRAAGYGAMQDINQNQQSDFQDALEGIRNEQRYQDQMNLKREQTLTQKEQGSAKLQIERERLQAQKDIADKQLQIARENKNKYDKPGKKSN